MSHKLSLKDVRLSHASVIRAARFLGLSYKEHDTVQFYDQAVVTGLSVQLPGWRFPVVIADRDQTVSYDNYRGNWGDSKEVSRLTGLALLDMQGENLSSVIVTEKAGELIFETS